MFTPYLRTWDNSEGRYQGIPKLITLYYLLHLGRLRPEERSHLPAVKQLPGSTKRAARYTAVVKWLLESASHKHFPSHCPDCSSADLNGDLWFFSFLITVQAFSRARFLWSPKWFSLNFFSPASPPKSSFSFQCSLWLTLLTFCFSLERQRVYNEYPFHHLALP